MKKCFQVTKQIRTSKLLNRRRSSAGRFCTSSAGAVTSLILLVVAILFSLTGTSDTYATTSSITVNISDNISLDIAPASADGTFVTSSTSTNNVSVKTTNGTGYTLGIKASADNSNALSTTGGASIPSHTITAGVSESNYQDDTYAETNNLNNTWGYRPSKLNSVSNSNYLPGPTSSSTVIELDKTNVANASTFNNYNLAIGARVDTATVPGEYSNVFVFTVVANPAVYSITYNKNTTDTVTNMPANVVNQQTSNETVTLDSARPLRDNFAFLGWCTVQVADNGACPGTTYNAGGTWALDQTLATNSLNLYAIWGEPTLYNYVAGMSKGTQDVTALRTAIDAPDETETVSTNSGVYEYNASVFGTASDDSSACTRAGGCPIYYYRGILDSYGHTGTYGSNGDNDAFPNTVVLSSASSKSDLTTDDTCWRIVRTTGSGGVKMIYQGKWTANGTRGNCKNNLSRAQVTTSAFSGTASTNQQIVRVGYTYNSTFAENTSNSDTIANIFGSNSSPEKNNVRSDIKKYIEDDWYSGAIGASSGHDYTSKLEASAGYCNDRTMNTTNSWTTPLDESTTIDSTYGTSSQQQYYFGAYPRNANVAQSPSLTCGDKYSQIDRSTVDLYRYVSSSTTDYTSNELKYPAALLTADEAAFAGSGWNSSTTPNHAKSYLRSGSIFWLLSPYYRNSNGNVDAFYLNSSGALNYDYVNLAHGVRPAISLTPGTTPASGTGTATDPWIVNPSPTMQSVTNQQLATLMPNEEDTTTLVDERDGQEYSVAKINDQYWMTKNLNLAGGTTLSPADSNVDSEYTLPESSMSGFSDDGEYVYNSNNTSCDNVNPCYSYYSYSAALALAVAVDEWVDICPKGWRLPTYSDFDNLTQEYPTGATLFASPFLSAPASYIINGEFDNYEVGFPSYYWSSDMDSSYLTPYFLEFSNDNFSPRIDAIYDNQYQGAGFSVRCVKQ